MIKFSFEEDYRDELYKMVEEAMARAVEETDKLFQELGEICLKYQYKKFYDLTNEICQYYGNEFKTMILAQIEEWQNSDTSLVAVAKEVEAADDDSDETVTVAIELQTKLLSVIEEYMSRAIDLPNGSTVARVTDDLSEIFENIDTIIKNFVEQIDDAKNNVDKLIADKADENQLYDNVGEVIVPILEDYRSLFDKFEQGAENLGVHLTEAATKAREKSESDKERLTQEATTKGGIGFEEVSNLFKIG